MGFLFVLFASLQKQKETVKKLSFSLSHLGWSNNFTEEWNGTNSQTVWWGMDTCFTGWLAHPISGFQLPTAQ